MAKLKILIVEDSKISARLIQKTLGKLGHEVSGLVASGEEAIKKVEKDKPDLVLMDIVLEGKMDGIETAEIMRSRFDIPVIYLTSHGDKKTLERAKRTEPFGFLIKPFKDIEIQINIEIALYKNKMEKKLKEREASLAESQRMAHIGSWELDIVNNKLSWSDEIFRIFEIEKNQFRASYEAFMDAVHPDDRENVNKSYTDSVKNKTPYDITHRLLLNDGRVKYVHESCKTFYDDRGTPIRSIGTVQDITEHKKGEDKLKLSSEVYEHAIEGVVVTDKDAVIQYANPAACKISGYDAEELIGQKTSIWKSDLHDKDFYKSMWKSFLEDGCWDGEIWNRRKDGTSFPVHASISAIKDYSGKTTQYAAIYYDLTSIKESEKKIRHIALHDSLTGLPNRTLFQDRLLHAITRSLRNKEKFAILFIDLDNFKHINDTMGHSVGDKFLRELSKRLLTCGRKGDTVSRLGGDEFALILENIKFEEEAGTVAKRIIEVFSESYQIGGRLIDTTVSIGIAIYPLNGKSVKDLLKNADLAMYHVKDIGKNNFHYFTKSLHKKAIKRMEVESGLKNAIKNDEITAYFQPKVDLKTGETVALETLVRWSKPDGVVVSPADFIQIAEDTGQIVDIDRLMMQKACSFFKRLRNGNQQLESISVNLSAVDFSSAGLRDRLLKTVDSFGLNPSNIEFEITESLIIKNIKSTIKLLLSLRDEGFGVSIDDFGTGYSSLSYLTKIPLTTLKLDRSFVVDLPNNPRVQSVATLIVKMAHSIGVQVVAEGVETKEQLELLRCIRCDQIQGYIFSRPLPEKEVEEFLAQSIVIPKYKPLILVVDDEEDIRDVLKKSLKELDVEFIEAENGKQAVEALEKHLPRLIILDITMPVMDGFKVLEYVRSNLKTKSIPVMVITGDASIEARNKIFQMGAKDFITKPFEIEDIIPRVRRFVS